MIVYLIGFMACGKSTLGRRVAKKLNWEYLDLDKYIEITTDKTISEIFNTDGEDAFRELEHKALIEISDQKENIIFSTGGGTPCFFNNMDFMNEKGLTIYLNASVNLLSNRLKNAKVKRPLIEKLNDVDLHKYISEKLSEREKFYKKSQFVIETKSINIHEILKIIESS